MLYGRSERRSNGVTSLCKPASTIFRTKMSLTIRLRSKEGTERVQVDPTTAGEDLAQLVRRVQGSCSLHSPSSTSRDLTPCSCSLPFQIVDALENADPDIDTITLSNAPGSSGQRFGLDALYGRSVADLGFKYVPCSPQSHLAVAFISLSISPQPVLVAPTD